MSRPFADAAVFRAVSDPVRRRIIELLRVREHTPTEIRELVDRAAATISVHLRVLRSTGIVKHARRGSSLKYSLDTARLRPSEAWMQRIQSSMAKAE